MRKIYQTEKYKRYSRRRSKKELASRIRHRKWLKKYYLDKFNLKKQDRIEWVKSKWDARKYQREIKIGKIFSFLNHPQKVMTTIKEIEEAISDNHSVYLNLSDLTQIDYSAVLVLVSVLSRFRKLNIRIDGSSPKDLLVRKKLIESDFFKYLEKNSINTIEGVGYSDEKDDQIFSSNQVDSRLVKKVIADASEMIWGEKRRCKQVARTLIELMQNTHNHADFKKEGKKTWWLSVNYDKKHKKVSFTFIDYGVGIFESLFNKEDGNKWYNILSVNKYKRLIEKGTHSDILRDLLVGKLHMTVTGESFRGKGLPGICSGMKIGGISNLHIISNGVTANVKDESYNDLILSSFSGTLVYWELDTNNQNIKWIQ